jgi:hypothetical protein
VILLCPTCGQPGVTDQASTRHPHPIRYCPACNLVYDQAKDVASAGMVREPLVTAPAFYEGLDAAREALHPTPKDDRG